MTEPKIYVADLAAYNNGKLHGVWIDATLDLEDIQAELTRAFTPPGAGRTAPPSALPDLAEALRESLSPVQQRASDQIVQRATRGLIRVEWRRRLRSIRSRMPIWIFWSIYTPAASTNPMPARRESWTAG